MLVNVSSVNVRKWVEKPENVYIGRPSKWGNPYIISGEQNREKVVELYEQYIKTNRVLLRDLHQLRGKNLGCVCYPQLCHGDIIQRLLQEEMSETQQQPEQPVVCRVVIVKNIGPTATADDISKLFHFHSTPFLRRNTCVEIRDEGAGTYAKIMVPSVAYDDVLKLHNVEFYGSKLQIEGDKGENSSDNSSTDAEPEPNPDPILAMLLDCRNYPDLNFPAVKEYEVCDALNIDHGDDPLKVVKPGWGRNIGTFEIHSDDLERYVDKSLTIRGHEISLTPIRKTPTREQQHQQRRQNNYDPEAIKIRIYDAFDRPYRSMENHVFDSVFEQLGVAIVIPTQIERRKDRRDFTPHRYIVVKKCDGEGKKVDFGERITVEDKTFKISYFGQMKFCGFCRTKHGWDCPVKARYNHLRTLREGKTGQLKIYSDSNLRQANQLALRSNVACMSGAGIGQLLNVIPFDAPHDEIVVSGGTNDLKGENLNEFVFSVMKIEEKLSKLASEKPVTVVLPSITEDVPELQVKGKFLRNSIEKVENVSVFNLQNIELDNTQHPTDKGTVDIIKQIHEKKDIIMEGCIDDVISINRYKGVQTLFKTGCRGCDDLTYTPFMCNRCKEESLTVDISSLKEQIETLTKEMFPSTNEVEMQESGVSGNKRGNDDNDNDSNTNKKPALDAASS